MGATLQADSLEGFLFLVHPAPVLDRSLIAVVAETVSVKQITFLPFSKRGVCDDESK